jgi:mannitol/fructose-specific phosphotransferase system IIA component (Ntr-type)
VTAACFGWYQYYARHRIARDGAIFHVFERLGRRRFGGLDRELRDLMKEKGLRAEDPFDQVVARGYIVDHDTPVRLGGVVKEAARLLARRLKVPPEVLEEGFGRGVRMGETPVAHGAALLHTRLPELEGSEMVLARCRAGVRSDVDERELSGPADSTPVRAVFFLVSGESDPGRHLRILAQIAGRVEDDTFMDGWLAASHEQALKETLLRDERFLTVRVHSGTPTETLVGRSLRELEMPDGSLIALIRRRGRSIVPRGRTVLQDGDRLTIIGEPAGLRKLADRFTRLPVVSGGRIPPPEA